MVWVLGRVEKNALKKVKKMLKIVFRSVALAIKKLWIILDFFTHSGHFTPLYPTLCIKKNFTKKNLQITNFEKSKNVHGDSVKNGSARANIT